MHMYATDATLHLGVSSVRPLLPELLEFVARTGFPAEKVTTVLADWEDAPTPTPRAPPSWSCTGHRSPRNDGDPRRHDASRRMNESARR